MNRSLTSPERDLLLRRRGVPAAAPTASFLARLQRAWCFAEPFHNLDLLAAAATGGTPLGPDEAVDRCVRGLGGPCHVQAVGFLALLQALEFDASLAAATIGHLGDHLGVRVFVDGRIWWSDVGNGQPYLDPFPGGDSSVQTHLGWTISSTSTGEDLIVERTSPDQPTPRRVYIASPNRQQAWSDFATIIDRHHREPGFGPFLTGLWVVRIGLARMTTVRDDSVAEYYCDRYSRSTASDEALVQFISCDLGLAELPVRAAVDTWRATRRVA